LGRWRQEGHEFEANLGFTVRSYVSKTKRKFYFLSQQVRVLELESQLQKERQKLGELRKKHYELAGVAEGWEEGKLP
jgi:hypothetical protein